jgi:hypothetical protein
MIHVVADASICWYQLPSTGALAGPASQQVLEAAVGGCSYTATSEFYTRQQPPKSEGHAMPVSGGRANAGRARGL